MPSFTDNDERLLLVAQYENMANNNDFLFLNISDFEQIIEFYLEEGKIQKAKNATHIALEQHPKSISIQLLYVEILIIEGDFNQASKLLDNLETLSTKNSDFFIQKALLLSKKNQHKEAINELKHGLFLNESATHIYSLIAMEYMYLGNYYQAKNYFTQAVELDTDDYFSLQQLLHCFDFIGNHNEAIDFLNSFIESNPFSDLAWFGLARQYTHIHRYEEAINAFDYAIACDDTLTPAYYEKGRILEMQHKFDEAIENYNITLSLEDPAPSTYLRIGRCYQMLNNSILAETYYLKSIHEDPQSSTAFFTLVEFYISENKIDKALMYLPKVFLNDYDNPNYWKRGAEIYTQTNQFKKAISAYEKAIEFGDNSAETLVALFDLHFQTQTLDNILPSLIKKINLNPEENFLYFLIGIALWNTENKTEAQYYLEKGKQKAPEWLFFFVNAYPNLFKEIQL